MSFKNCVWLRWAKNHFCFWMEGALSASIMTLPLTNADNAADRPADMAADNDLSGRPGSRILEPGRFRGWAAKTPPFQAFLARFLKLAW